MTIVFHFTGSGLGGWRLANNDCRRMAGKGKAGWEKRGGKRFHVGRTSCPIASGDGGEFDVLFYVKTLADLFSERAVIERTLTGEKVGAWFEDSA